MSTTASPDIFWFLPTSGDTRYLGKSNSGRTATPEYLQQIAVAGPYLGKRAETLAPIAKQAYENVNRGIVAYSGVD